MKRLFTLFTFILAFGIINAQETYHFRTDAPQGISIESSSATGLALHYSISEINMADIERGDYRGQEITLKGSFGSTAEGLPNLPFENCYIAVPQGAKVSINVNEKASRTFEGIDLLPVAELQMNGEAGAPAIRKDMSVFGKDADFPSNNVDIAQNTRIRGLDVVLLNVTPFRYNPMRSTLEVIYDMDIEVRFEGGNGQFGEERYRNPDWDHILRDLVINDNMLPEAHYYDILNNAENKVEIGCEYLIIAPDDDSILAWADTLRRFRNKQGVLTKVVTTTDCGGNYPDAIKGYIHNAYDNWDIPPAAVMLFGGMTDTIISHWPDVYGEGYSGIPGFPLIFKKYDYENGTIMDFNYYSDNPYVDMNDDSIPDIAISRLPAFTVNEYQLQIQKLIEYETHAVVDPHYYDHPVITAGHEENKWFLLTSQLVDGFCRTKLGRHPTNLYMMYNEYLPRPDSVWSTGQNTDAVVDYFGPNGQNYVPGDVRALNHWVGKEDSHLLINAINEETFLTLYRDHSASDYWCCPYFDTYDIQFLKNANPTFILSIGCDAANFEFSYSLHYSGWKSRSVITEFCNVPVGALGGIGATTVTRSHFNDRLTWGFLDYIWPNFMPTLGSSSDPAFVRPSYALVAGKLFLTQGAFMANWWPSQITDTHNVFHYLGEAYLNLYTEVPQHMSLEVPPFHPDNQWQYEFTAEEGALVCISRDGEFQQAAIATGQHQSLTIPQMEVGTQFLVTVTKQNRFRFEQTVTVVSAQQPNVYMKASELHDQDGNGQLDYGETATIGITIHNSSAVASNGGQVTLLCESPHVEILQGKADYPHIEPDAELTLHNAFHIKVLPDVPDQTPLTFMLQFNEGQNTHFDRIIIEANAPVLCIEPEYRPMTAEGEPSTHIATEGKSKLAFTVTNKGHSAASLFLASLDIKAPFVEIEFPQMQLESLAPNESHNFTFELNTNPNDITGAWLQSHFNIQHLEHNVWLDTIVQYGGIFESFETDTLNQAYSWPPGPNGFWSYHDNAYEGQRCLRFTLEDHYGQLYTATARVPYQVNHDCKTSFRYKTDRSDFFSVSINGKTNYLTASDTWAYMETLATVKHQRVVWRLDLTNSEPIGDTLIAYIDDICFPPPHTTIAFAGSELLSCGENPVKLSKAYAYDCNSILWVTDGDGHFDCDTVANPFYTPGSQDMENGSVTLTLSVYGNDTIISTTAIHFMEEINLGEIVGDSVVNKYEHPISHYRVDNPEGLNLIWELDPASAGYIYGFGDAVDILWDQSQGDIEANLHVFTNYDCTALDKHISLIGYSTPEWHETSFELFPNPTDGKVNLVFGETMQGKVIVEVYNLLGEQMIAKKVSHLQKGETYTLDLSHLVSGLYIIKMSTENGSCSKKVSVR